MKSGIVEWFGTKGEAYGYLMGDDGVECYVHYKNILADNQENPRFRTLKPGQRVEFEVGTGHYTPEGGTQALKVKVVIDVRLGKFGTISELDPELGAGWDSGNVRQGDSQSSARL